MVVVAAHLRTRSIVIFPYIDDWLVVIDSWEVLLDQIHATLSLLRILGLQNNLAKSVLEPSQRICFIGATLDTKVCRAFLPLDRAHSLRDTALYFQTVSRVSA